MRSAQRMMLLSSGLAVAAVSSLARAGSSTPADREGHHETAARHHYVDGERFAYFFEDLETTFNADTQDGVLQPGTLQRLQELRIPFEIDVKADSKGELRRTLRFQGGSYRESEPAAFSTATFKALSDIIPGFPADFSYAYETDARAITSALPKAFGPYLGDRLGQFVYYKAIDIHTFQAKDDRMPETLGPQGLVQAAARDVDLPDGVFHNAGDAILDQRIVTFKGVRCAFFKGVTMGNSYALKDTSAPKIYTNYQYTFYVPLEGPEAGLVVRGDMQETVTIPPKMVIQRQLSIETVDGKL